MDEEIERLGMAGFLAEVGPMEVIGMILLGVIFGLILWLFLPRRKK